MLGMVAGLAGSVVSGMGAMSAANGEAQQMEYNAKVAKINARSDRQQGQAKIEQMQIKQKELIGEQTAAFGKNNVDPFFGSAMAIFADTSMKNNMDDNNTWLAAESSAVGNENKARDLEAQAANKRKAGKIAMASSILSGIGGAGKSLASAGGGGGGGTALFLNG